MQKTKETRISLSCPLPQSRRGWPSVVLFLLSCTISSQSWVLMSPSGKVWGEKSSLHSSTGYFRGNRLNWGCSISTSNACQEMFGSLRVLVTDTLTKCMEVSSGKWLLSLSQINVYCDSRPCFNTKIFFSPSHARGKKNDWLQIRILTFINSSHGGDMCLFIYLLGC